MKEKVVKPAEEWKKKLTPEQSRILRQQGTERAFTGQYWNHKEEGTYQCAGCGLELFSSKTKFDSGCGWPSFMRPLESDHIVEKKDLSHGMVRTEVRSLHGDSHLGHVFNDGPVSEGGLRYCINSASLRFIPKERLEEEGYGEYVSLFEE